MKEKIFAWNTTMLATHNGSDLTLAVLISSPFTCLFKEGRKEGRKEGKSVKAPDISGGTTTERVRNTRIFTHTNTYTHPQHSTFDSCINDI